MKEGKEIEKIEKEEIKQELPPEAIDKIMEKAQDINEPGTGIHGIPGGAIFTNRIRFIVDVLKRGMSGRPYTEKDLTPELYSELRERIRKRRNAESFPSRAFPSEFYMNVLGRSVEGKDFDGFKTNRDGEVIQKLSDLMYTKGLNIIFDTNALIRRGAEINVKSSGDPTSSLTPQQKEIVRKNYERIQKGERASSWEELDFAYDSYGFVVDGRLPSRLIKGIVFSKPKDSIPIDLMPEAEEYSLIADKLRDAGILDGFDRWEKTTKQKMKESSLESRVMSQEEIEKDRKLASVKRANKKEIGRFKELSDKFFEENILKKDGWGIPYIKTWGREDDPEKIKYWVDKMSKEMVNSFEDNPEKLVPIYDIDRNMLWPKKMSYDEVKDYIAEKD